MGKMAGRSLGSRLGEPLDRFSKQSVRRSKDKDRPSQRWKNSKAWKSLRRRVLERDGYRCVKTGMILVEGRDAPNAAVVDHIVPHDDDPHLFWDESNLQSVCKSYHDKTKQIQERRGEFGF
ncbi:MAG: HNH endonuclease signature motif containing protein [Pseudomonadota bacterium]